MATKHINDELWNRIEALTVKANTMHGLLRPIKEAEVLPGFWNAAHRGETAVISLRADSADYAIARITDLMCEALLGYKGQRAWRPAEDEQGE